MNHVVSHATEEDVIKINPNAKITTIYNGIDVTDPHFSTNLEYQEFILYIGRVVITKYLEVVILAFRDVVKTFPLPRLVIAGDSPMIGEWKHVVRNNDLDKNVIFMGYVSEA